MGTCSSNSSHCQQAGIGQKVQEGSGPELLVFEPGGGDKDAIGRNAKAEERAFGYSVISQEGRGGGQKENEMPETGERRGVATVAAGGGPLKALNDMNLLPGGRDGRLVYHQQLQPPTSDLKMYIVTWNMNGKALARSISRLLEVDGEKHDLYVIGLQEAHNSIAESVITEALGEKYSFVAAASMVSLQLFIIGKKTILPFLSRPLTDKISTGGLGGFAGRQKGAVAITLRFKEATLLFIACHLAPHEGNVQERNAQYRRIAQMVFAKQAPMVLPLGAVCCSPYRNGLIADEPGGLCMEHPFRTNSKFIDRADMVVWMGDLNYRVEMSRSSVAFLIRHKLEEMLWSKDQLSRALKRGQAFIGFKEGQLSFRPTYKYDVGTDNYDTSSKERVPSWTDRILYKVNVGEAGKLSVRLNSYNCINSIKTSDHRPVRALLTMSLVNQDRIKYVQ